MSKPNVVQLLKHGELRRYEAAVDKGKVPYGRVSLSSLEDVVRNKDSRPLVQGDGSNWHHSKGGKQGGVKTIHGYRRRSNNAAKLLQ